MSGYELLGGVPLLRCRRATQRPQTVAGGESPPKAPRKI